MSNSMKMFKNINHTYTNIMLFAKLKIENINGNIHLMKIIVYENLQPLRGE